MARTTMTAKKATGAPAPHVPIQGRLIRKEEKAANAQDEGKQHVVQLVNCILLTDDRPFVCPACHLASTPKEPYPFKILCNPATRMFMPAMRGNDILIISLRLADITHDGDVATGIANFLGPYTAVHLHEIPFNYASNSSATAASILKLERLLSTKLQHVKHFAILLLTHTDPVRGDLHHSAANTGAGLPGDLIQTLLSASIMDRVVQPQNRSIFALLACGAIWRIPPAMQSLVAATAQFSALLGFGAPKFIPTVTSHFIQDALLHYLVFERDNISTSLFRAANVGAHSSVILREPRVCFYL
ncbi:hypothetical protein FISHEDRAFT_73988 [Fistulina hepatica ATCC 64428]|uniref:Uncharacterized protein n=1 Tax=Fistulina hepatica ATCC 64428 TaxID=1128425 RepID=A0A0D7ADX8_9AGAR|nr:hypothetical protein FISHEDRAFT_73988 [Fistulina hepatica ATCC 64428]